MASLRIMAACAAFALGGCQIWHVPAESAAAPPPPAPRIVATPAPPPAPPPPVNPPLASGPALAASPAAPPPPRQTASAEGDETVVVRGQFERQVPAPEGDPRTTEERMAHIRAWDRCVMRAQGTAESDANRVQLDTPEDLCRQSLGMSGRDGIPNSFEP